MIELTTKQDATGMEQIVAVAELLKTLGIDVDKMTFNELCEFNWYIKKLVQYGVKGQIEDVKVTTWTEAKKERNELVETLRKV